MQLDAGWINVRYALEKKLDSVFDQEPGACIEFDSILSLDQIQRLNYLRNFPHLTCLCGNIPHNQAKNLANSAIKLDRDSELSGINFSLLPATCYKVYIDLENTNLTVPSTVCCIAKCFRNEDKPLDEYRSLSFTMKEFVHIGNSDQTQVHADDGLKRIGTLLDAIDIPFHIEVASDPFFDANSSQAILSRLIPTKREVVFEGHAISSANIHRNYFGELFNITYEGAFASTSCVAFGLERWLQMLRGTFQTPENALTALEAVKI